MNDRFSDAHYSGESGPIFGLGLKTAFLTLITLGIYRFWGKTRIRKFIWSSTSVGGDRFEYTGTGLEKFLGFLIAVVFLAVYLGLIQMVLFFFGLNLMIDPETASPQEFVRFMAALYISIFAVVPFILFAVYRARRYKLARTRFRGIRFGMDSAVWGYVWRAIGHSLLTTITLGILLPRQTFYLEKYMTDRMWYGDARFEQQGKWTALYGAMKHVFIGMAILLGGIIAGVALEIEVLAGAAAVIGYIWLMIGFISYGVQSFAYLTSHKVLGGEVTFTARPQTSTVVITYTVGTIVIGVGFGLAVAVFALIVFADSGFGAPGQVPGIGSVIFGALAYLASFLVAGAASLALITQPIIRHYVDRTTVHNVDALDAIRQRAFDKGADAEGFADALDIGGAV